jgi:hypothetical protein
VSDESRIHDATRAQEVLGNEAFTGTLERLENTYVKAWKNAKTLEAREDAHRYVQLCRRFEGDLKSIVLDGQLTAKRVKELEGRKTLW